MFWRLFKWCFVLAFAQVVFLMLVQVAITACTNRVLAIFGLCISGVLACTGGVSVLAQVVFLALVQVVFQRSYKLCSVLAQLAFPALVRVLFLALMQACTDGFVYFTALYSECTSGSLMLMQVALCILHRLCSACTSGCLSRLRARP